MFTKQDTRGEEGEHISLIQTTNYKPEKKSTLRKQALKKAILKNCFDSILISLKQLQEESSGYKTDRIENDIRWLKNESRKGRFNSEKIETGNKENYGSKFHSKKEELGNLS